MITEKNIISSFRNVKRDIASLREQISRISEQQEEISNAVFNEECEPSKKKASKNKRR